jgi:hypothetical protein
MLDLGGVGTGKASHFDVPNPHCASPCIARGQCAGTRATCIASQYYHLMYISFLHSHMQQEVIHLKNLKVHHYIF